MRIVSILLLSFVLSGCIDSRPKIKREPLWPDIDLSLYESVPDLREPTLTPAHIARDWIKVHPAEPVNYWEFRFDETIIVAQAGEKCKTASDPNICVANFDAIKGAPNEGARCKISPPDFCSYAIVSNYGDTNHIWDSLEKLRAFFGEIDSKEEAILLAFGNGLYGSNTNKAEGAIREIDNEYELIILVHFRPIHDDEERRLLTRIDRSGVRRGLREHIPLR